jgi:hypothetical protein
VIKMGTTINMSQRCRNKNIKYSTLESGYTARAPIIDDPSKGIVDFYGCLTHTYSIAYKDGCTKMFNENVLLTTNEKRPCMKRNFR